MHNPSALQILARQRPEGQAYWFLNALSTVKFSSQETGGAFAMVEERMPAGRGTPYHLHHHEDETFYVLEGELTFFSEGQRITGTPGFSIFLPRKIPHGFRAETPAHILVLATPGGFDQFVAEAGEPAGSLVLPAPSEPDIGRLTSCAEKYGIEILGPLPD